jgi:uncharacterized membrane protein
MSEFKQGIFNALKLLGTSSLALAIIYTLGHIVIAMSVVSVMTGASLFEAGLVALVEPSINGVWFYVLHKFGVNSAIIPKQKHSTIKKPA